MLLVAFVAAGDDVGAGGGRRVGHGAACLARSGGGAEAATSAVREAPRSARGETDRAAGRRLVVAVGLDHGRGVGHGAACLARSGGGAEAATSAVREAPRSARGETDRAAGRRLVVAV